MAEEMLELTRKQLEAVLIAHHRIQPDKQVTFRSRIKTIQRMGFPPGTNVGRGPKVSYTAEHMLMLVSVFELQQVGLPAERAIKTVLAGWDYLKVGYGVAFQLQDQFDPIDEKIFGWIHGRALRDLQFELQIPFHHAGIPSASAITGTELVIRLQRVSPASMQHSFLVLDLSGIVQSVVQSSVNSAGIDDVTLGLELHEWAEHKGGYLTGFHPLKPKEVGDEFD